MATPRISFVSKDWQTIRAELIARIPSITSRWTDMNESDPGVTIVELLTAMVDEMLFYLDQSANEAFLPTAVQRGDVINLTKLIDYKAASITSATAKVTFNPASCPLSTVYPITIPPYTQISTAENGGIKFVTTTHDGATDPTPVAYDILNTNSPVVMNAVQGSKSVDNFISDGTAVQKYKLSASDIDSSTVLVTVSGNPWTKVSSFVSADLNSQFYTVDVDASGNVYVTFGDGQFGQIPPDTSPVAITYVVSGGEAGSVGASRITVLLDSLRDGANAKVTGLAVSNSEASTLGLSPEPIERTKLLAPALLAALFTAKSKADYNAIAQSASTAVTKVNTWGEAEEAPPNYKMFNKVQIVFAGYDTHGKVLVPDTDPLSEWQTVKSAIKTLINGGDKKIITTRNVIVDPAFVNIIVGGTVYVDLTLYDGTTVLASVGQAIKSYLGYAVSQFGQDVYLSQLNYVVGQVPGVSWSNLTLSADPSIFPDTTSRYVYDTAPNPALSSNRVIGVVLRKYELPIVEDDVETGLTTGITHIQAVVADAIDQPRPGDVLNSPCQQA